MDHITDKERLLLIEQAVAGDKKALETLVLGVQDLRRTRRRIFW